MLVPTFFNASSPDEVTEESSFVGYTRMHLKWYKLWQENRVICGRIDTVGMSERRQNKY